MRLLLDTLAFIWWDSNPTKLTPRVRALCEDPTNTLLLSVASIWEMQIKCQLGKLTLALPLADLVANQQKTNRIQVLPISLAHVLALDSLSPLHRDPFDRLLITQAIAEDATLVSRDPVFSDYPVNILW